MPGIHKFIFRWERDLDFFWCGKNYRRWWRKTSSLCVLKCHFWDLRFRSFVRHFYRQRSLFLRSRSLSFVTLRFSSLKLRSQPIDNASTWFRVDITFFCGSWLDKSCRKNPFRIRNRLNLCLRPLPSHPIPERIFRNLSSCVAFKKKIQIRGEGRVQI